jgi:hypothetical protein
VEAASRMASSRLVLRRKTVKLRIVKEAITEMEDMAIKTLCRATVSMRLR